jgi:hypothetical protein
MMATATAVTFVWLGMVLAISFLETPLKFQAPGVDLRTGLAIGRLVFGALNTAEIVFAAAVLSCLFTASRPSAAVAAAGSTLILVVQVSLVRPGLTRRSRSILAGADIPRSHAHHVYVGLEAAKVVALLTTGILLLRHP